MTAVLFQFFLLARRARSRSYTRVHAHHIATRLCDIYRESAVVAKKTSKISPMWRAPRGVTKIVVGVVWRIKKWKEQELQINWFWSNIKDLDPGMLKSILFLIISANTVILEI